MLTLFLVAFCPGTAAAQTITNGAETAATLVANTTFVLLAATNLTPPTSWTPILTNQFDSFGAFDKTNLFNSSERERYFWLLEQ